MAANQFFVESGGDDVAAGSTTGAAAVTSTNGNWSTVTNIFTPAGGGTPFSGVAVNDWASVYIDGATLVVYIAQITTVNSGGATVTLSTTAKYGTAPATSATARSIKVGGAHATPFAFINTGTTAVYNSTQINIKQATYASTTTARTFNNTGAATAMLIWSGYNTTTGDCDTNFTLTHPTMSWTTGLLTISGVKQVFRNINFTGARTASAQSVVSAEVYFRRCRFENTAANVNGISLSVQSTTGPVFSECQIKATSTASTVIDASVGGLWHKCIIEGGGIGLTMTSSQVDVSHCIFVNGSHGINQGVQRSNFQYCTFVCTGDGVHYTATPTTGQSFIRKCLFANCAWGINNAGGTNTQIIAIEDCDFYNCSSGNINSLTDSYQYNGLTESTNPLVNGSTDPTLTATATGAAVASAFEAHSYTGVYYDVGALQRRITSIGIATTQAQVFYRGGVVGY